MCTTCGCASGEKKIEGDDNHRHDDHHHHDDHHDHHHDNDHHHDHHESAACAQKTQHKHKNKYVAKGTQPVIVHHHYYYHQGDVHHHYHGKGPEPAVGGNRRTLTHRRPNLSLRRFMMTNKGCIMGRVRPVAMRRGWDSAVYCKLSKMF